MIVLQSGFFGLFSNVNAFLVFFILLGGIFGLMSHKLSIAGYGSLLVFTHVAMETERFIFGPMLYLVLTLLFLYLAAQIAPEYMGETGGEAE